MRAICLYFHMHQPWRYRRYSIFDVAHNHNYWYEKDYYDKQNNERIFRKVAQKSYYPMLELLEQNLRKFPNFKFSLSITGVWLEQAEEWEPELITKLQQLVASGRVEIVGETYYHSLAFFYNRDEFQAQVKKHSDKIAELFGVRPMVFRNTEFAYNDEVGRWADQMGYTAVLAEGWDKILGWRSPNHVYKVAGGERTRLLLKNYRLSDDIAFRFSDKNWREWPLTVPKFQSWLNEDALNGNLINLFMDFETFGENIWEDTGIFDFMNELISSWLSEFDNRFVTVSEAAGLEQPVDAVSMPETVTWADTERDLSAWLGNEMQREAENNLYAMYNAVMASRDADLIDDWRRLTTSDHPYYMCTKYWNDGDVHAYFSPFDSPYDAFMYYMNVIRDFEWRIENLREQQKNSFKF
ncbi:glycoside hydrolase family 57 protein [Candidatus Saccharibacteria bacterium]|nr:glycoside hydrolase family 57 protein [Candidatus Saccharibacteria bacterium]